MPPSKPLIIPKSRSFDPKARKQSDGFFHVIYKVVDNVNNNLELYIFNRPIRV